MDSHFGGIRQARVSYDRRGATGQEAISVVEDAVNVQQVFYVDRW